MAKVTDALSKLHSLENLDIAKFSEQEKRLKRIEAICRTFSLAPATSIGRRSTRDIERRGQPLDDHRPATLHKSPRSLQVLWDEYVNGIANAKPASEFSDKERGRVAVTYSRRKVFWDAMNRMIRNFSYTRETALARVERIYGHYGSVTKQLNQLRIHENAGGHHELGGTYRPEDGPPVSVKGNRGGRAVGGGGRKRSRLQQRAKQRANPRKKRRRSLVQGLSSCQPRIGSFTGFTIPARLGRPPPTNTGRLNTMLMETREARRKAGRGRFHTTREEESKSESKTEESKTTDESNGCAAGDLCGMKGTPLRSFHKCKVCKKTVHSFMCCEKWDEDGNYWCKKCGYPREMDAEEV